MWYVSYLFAAPWGNHKGLPLLSKNKTWLHIQDYELDAAFALGFVKLKPLWRIATLFERGLLRSFDRVSTISERMMERLKMKGVKPENSFLFPNWIDTDTIFPLDRMGTIFYHFCSLWRWRGAGKFDESSAFTQKYQIYTIATD